jgi:hypothetical protein
VIDISGTLVLIFGVLTALSAPLLGRLDPWSLTPIVLGLLARISYVGAANAAAEYAEDMNTAYDLHRFDMITALHLPLPADAEQELSDNTRLTAFLGSVGPLKAAQRSTWRYVHAASQPAPAEPGQSVIVIREPGGETATTIAAVLLAIRDRTGRIPHVYFNWTEGRANRASAKAMPAPATAPASTSPG